MKLETFFKHFDLLAEAPNGVQKLRELILDLAVRGKLVPQDANDEPAAVLLERIKTEKERLVKEGKIKKSEPLAEITPDKIPYNLPKNWEWVRLGNITEIIRGITFPASEKSKEPGINKIPCLRTANVQEEIEWDDLLYIREKYVKKDSQIICENDIVMSMANSKELVGKVAIIRGNLHKKVTFGGFLGVIRVYRVTPYFILLLLKSSYARNILIDSSSQTTNIANISLGKLNPFILPLPPLAEQKRIVSKVDELMKLCDELEARQKKKRETRILINNAALNKLLTADTPQTFTKNWQCISDNFDIFYSAPENIGKLRQAILQLAVMGKLVPQDANDESAAVLLERIKKEKERLVKEGKIKKEKSLTAIKDDEIPFDLPKGWEWERVTNLCEHIVDCLHSTPAFITEGKLCIDTTCLNQGEILFHKVRKVSEETFLERIRRLQPLAGDILFSREGTIGLSIVVPEGLEICLGQRMMMFRTFRCIIPEYFRYVLISKMFVNQWEKKLIGTAAHHINIGDIKKMIIPFPPVNEQKRIVTKVDKLMKLCDELESKLTQTQTESEKIINAAVKQLLMV